jgi:mRNA interferase MazF
MGVAGRVAVARFEVYQIDLDPTRGSEIRKLRPCVIVSPDEMNRQLRAVVVAPMTSHGRKYPTRVAVQFRGTDGLVVLDELRKVDKVRLAHRLGDLDPRSSQRVLAVLAEMFAP